MDNTPEFNLKKNERNLLKHRSKKSMAFEIVLIILLIYSFMFIIGGCTHDIDIAVQVGAYISFAFCPTYLVVCCVIMKNYSNIRDLINAVNDKFAVAVDIYSVVLLIINVLVYLLYFASFFSVIYNKSDSFKSLLLYSTLVIPYIDAYHFPIMYYFRHRSLPRTFLKFKVAMMILIPVTLYYYAP